MTSGKKLCEWDREFWRDHVETDGAFQSWGLCWYLLQESSADRFTDVRRGHEHAELALAVAGVLDETYYGSAHVADLRCLVWTNLGMFLRILGEPSGARSAAAKAAEFYERGTGSGRILGRLRSFQASLEADEGRLTEALGLASEALALFRRSEDADEELQALLQIALLFADAHKPRVAVAIWRRIMPRLLDHPQRELTFLALQRMALGFVEEGRVPPKLEEVLQDPPPPGSALDLTRRWHTAYLDYCAGRLESAEEIYRLLRATYLEQGSVHEAALLMLDLLHLHLERDHRERAYDLAQDFRLLLLESRIEGESASAVVDLLRSIHARQLTVQVIDRCRSRLLEAARSRRPGRRG